MAKRDLWTIEKAAIYHRHQPLAMAMQNNGKLNAVLLFAPAIAAFAAEVGNFPNAERPKGGKFSAQRKSRDHSFD